MRYDGYEDRDMPLGLTRSNQASAVPGPSRAERRREAKAQQGTPRLCFRCGFGAVKGVANSNLVKAKDLDNNDAWSHASPVVCAGYIRAITMQARETVSEAGSDFFRILRLRAEGWIRWQVATLKSFIRSDGGAGMNTVGGTPQRIRANTQRESR